MYLVEYAAVNLVLYLVAYLAVNLAMYLVVYLAVYLEVWFTFNSCTGYTMSSTIQHILCMFKAQQRSTEENHPGMKSCPLTILHYIKHYIKLYYIVCTKNINYYGLRHSLQCYNVTEACC